MTATLDHTTQAPESHRGLSFTLDPHALRDALAWASRGLSKRPPRPALAGIHIHSGAGIVTFSAYDQSVSASSSVEATVTTPGEILVHGARLSEIAKTLPDKDVTFEASGTRVLVTSGRSKFTLHQMPAEDYPRLPAKPDPVGQVDGSVFAATVGRLATFASRDPAVAQLHGIHLRYGDTLDLAATDRYKIAVEVTTWQPTFAEDSGDVLLRADQLQPLAKALSGAGGVALGYSEHTGTFSLSTPGRTATIGVMGESVDWDRIRTTVRQDRDHAITFDTTELRDAVQRIRTVVNEAGMVRFDITEGTCRISAESESGEDATEDIDCDPDGIGEYATAYHPEWLGSLLATITAPRVRIGVMAEQSKPSLIDGIGSDGQPQDHYRTLTMPKRLRSTT